MYLEKYDLKGRVAVVTGGGQGIGLACARALGEAGATVVVAEMQPERVEGATAELKGLGINAVGMALDVTRSAQVDEVAARVGRELGPAHILVNNAGIAKSDVRAEDTSESTGACTWTSTWTACSGAAAPSAGRCWRPAAARS